jgi:hypothetical protein
MTRKHFTPQMEFYIKVERTKLMQVERTKLMQVERTNDELDSETINRFLISFKERFPQSLHSDQTLKKKFKNILCDRMTIKKIHHDIIMDLYLKYGTAYTKIAAHYQNMFGVKLSSDQIGYYIKQIKKKQHEKKQTPIVYSPPEIDEFHDCFSTFIEE